LDKCRPRRRAAR